MVSWFGQTAKDLFRHLAFNKDDLSDMKGEVFIRELTDVSILPIYLFVHKMCMLLFARSFFFTILCSFEKKRTWRRQFLPCAMCCKLQPWNLLWHHAFQIITALIWFVWYSSLRPLDGCFGLHIIKIWFLWWRNVPQSCNKKYD